MKKKWLSKIMIWLTTFYFMGYPIVLNGQKTWQECEECMKIANFEQYEEGVEEIWKSIKANKDILKDFTEVTLNRVVSNLKVGNEMPELGISENETLKILAKCVIKQGFDIMQDIDNIYSKVGGHFGEFFMNVGFEYVELLEEKEGKVEEFTIEQFKVDVGDLLSDQYAHFTPYSVYNNLCLKMQSYETHSDKKQFLKNCLKNVIQISKDFTIDEKRKKIKDQLEILTYMQFVYIIQKKYPTELGGVINVYIDMEEVVRDKPKEPLKWYLQDLPKDVYIEYVGIFSDKIMARLNELGKKGTFNSIFDLPIKKCIHYVLYEDTEPWSYDSNGRPTYVKIYRTTLADVLDERNYSIYHTKKSKIESIAVLIPEYWEKRSNYTEYRIKLKNQWDTKVLKGEMEWGCRGHFDLFTAFSIDGMQMVKRWEENPKYFWESGTDLEAFLLPAHRIIFTDEKLSYSQFNMIE